MAAGSPDSSTACTTSRSIRRETSTRRKPTTARACSDSSIREFGLCRRIAGFPGLAEETEGTEGTDSHRGTKERRRTELFGLNREGREDREDHEDRHSVRLRCSVSPVKPLPPSPRRLGRGT